MSNTLQTLTTLDRTIKDMTGRAVHIYRKRTMILSKEQAKEYKDLEKKAIAEEKKNDLKKWEGVSMIPRPS